MLFFLKKSFFRYSFCSSFIRHYINLRLYIYQQKQCFIIIDTPSQHSHYKASIYIYIHWKMIWVISKTFFFWKNKKLGTPENCIISLRNYMVFEDRQNVSLGLLYLLADDVFKEKIYVCWDINIWVVFITSE